jgi:hypothetical protein
MYTKKVENEKIVNLEFGGFIEYLKLMSFVFFRKNGLNRYFTSIN